jgi:hypothetical protein
VTNLHNETPLDKAAYEFKWARQLARKGLSEENYKIWQAYKSVDRLSVNLRAVFVHWGWHQGKTLIFKEFKLSEVKVAVSGVTYTLSDNAGNQYPVNHTPALIAGTGIFAWVPHFNEFRHVPADWENAEEPGYLRVGICVWQPSNPHKVRIGAHSYITTKKIFEKDWAFQTLNQS